MNMDVFKLLDSGIGKLTAVLIIAGGLFLIGYLTYLEEKWQ